MDKEDLALLGPALESFLAEFADVAITPTRKLIAAYLRGQLGPLPRKSVMPMARDAGIAPRTLQELLSLHRWDEQLMVDTLQRHVWRRRGSVESVATILESCCPKKGTRTPGVEMQRCGPSGRTRNCVQLLHLGFSDGDFTCVLDNALYLPRSWTDSRDRRERARIPEALKHRTKAQIALDLLDRAWANGVRFGWVYVGIDYASDPQFLKDLEARGLRTVAPRPTLREGGPALSGRGPGSPTAKPERPPRRWRAWRAPAKKASAGWRSAAGRSGWTTSRCAPTSRCFAISRCRRRVSSSSRSGAAAPAPARTVRPSNRARCNPTVR